MDNTAPRRSLLQLLLLAAVLGASWHVWQSGVIQAPPPAPRQITIADEDLAELRPREEPHRGFSGSAACVECHRNQHRSWSNSWHRTMTQVASMATFMGSLDEHLVAEGVRYRFSQRDDRPWFHVENPPPHFNPAAADRRDYPVVMTTGSHLMQLGWFPVGHSDTLGMLPLAYLKEDRRWVPISSIFLQPPEIRSSTRIGIWNDGCIRCHTTGPETRRHTGGSFEREYGFDTRVAEFGIACEACHGPGEAHARLQRSAAGKQAVPDDPIVNPAHIDHERASEICGACHGDTSPRASLRQTPYHLPGQPLSKRYQVNEPPSLSEESQSAEAGYHQDGTTMYWSDGQARVSGAEFSAFRVSRCYTEGEISCLSCHALHQSSSDPRPVREWASDMLGTDALTDAACLRCHEAASYADRRHTIHAPTSEGSRCYNCHMPHTSYGLLKAIRSHAITSPSVRETRETGRLNACNLCHLDQSLAWTAGELRKHYGHEDIAELPEDQRQVSAAVWQALTGDAGQRALIAWSMSWPPAVSASGGGDWIPPHLANLLEDPYTVVRYIAGKSLRQLPGFADLDYDHLAKPTRLAEQAASVIQNWRSTNAHPTALIGTDGKIQTERFRQLRSRRNDRDIVLLE